MHAELFRAEGLPVLQNRVYDRREDALAATRGDVVLVQDAATGLVHNRAFDPALIVYDRDYQNEQACSPVFRAHLEQVLAVVRPFFSGRRVLEIGCGKGSFLELLRENGFAATGVDPAYEGNSPHVVKAAFTPELNLRGDGIVLRHVLEHIPDPASFLASIASANGGEGQVYIEVPCFDWIRERRAWFDIFYEHVNYFRLPDFQRMFGTILASGHLFGGQYMYVVAELDSLRTPTASADDQISMPADFLAGVQSALARARAHAGPRTVWGGSSKGVIFAGRLAGHGIHLDAAIDINPAKQGKYLPATGLPVLSPEQAMDRLERGSLVFVMNPNYFDEIVRQSQRRFDYQEV
jgi:SAM-dependent methyltransferase